jgi:hypothetical protein
MSLEDLGNIGEIVAAVGVIISLVYLAVQIRQNTKQITENVRSLQVAAFQSIQQSGHQVRAQAIAEASSCLKGLNEPALLTPEERFKFNMVMMGVVLNLREVFLLRRWEAIDPQFWGIMEQFIGQVACQPGGRAYLEQFTETDASEFGVELRRLLSEVPASSS